ncbi:MAG: NADH-quinone oxidoreductase subunit L [Candidatus Omnitrophica bacterium]|nr:NADH-quinone oxidoreductase subunit L [Candidatus Omnitrophota bacterium]MDE2010079.1 NADH-quinone oxidoreductase subunit L [Candidatus Omnitrophota bacterium]MDE2215181.1 NADH-quinone oxidoreductase subunit L [Candidatus Omnitrophota bacterium]MDE2232086.1 NADH-quinone oxidoreductase subunit L [Candidatus Omnitrophota bacterium]
MVDPHLVWTAFFAPLAACVLITLLFLKNKTASSLVAIAGILTSFICSCLVFGQIFHTQHPAQLQQSLAWIHFDALTINFGFLMNPLAIVMLLIVTGVGSAIFIYSRGYMDEDPSAPRFFAELSLFAFSMIGIVLSNNFIQLFIFWELVGLSSYLLIGFWYTKPSAADAGVKAFLVNRLSDFGFLCGILLLWSVSGIAGGVRSFQFTDLAAVVPLLNPHLLTVIALLLFCGVVGKSAQIPLHVWLIDAMEGPTPVSALIHAATMVAAGVYFLARVFFVFAHSPTALTTIAYVGAITSLMAAILAVAENDIKRILAYSTLSQLGLMVMALGLGGPVQGMYHLTTHAFFKALLFLGAGSVIHALHEEQNIWNMRGLWKKMPITGWTFFIGMLALSGIPPLSGFWSKDAILYLAFKSSFTIYLIAAVACGLTAFYMGRLFCVAFWGKPSESHGGHGIHESPAVMTVPLIFLAVLSVIGGFIGIPHFLSPQETPEKLNMGMAAVSSVVAFLGLGFAYMFYGRRPAVDPLIALLKNFYTAMKNKFYFDIVYGWYVDHVQQNIALFLYRFEREFIVRLFLGGVTAAARAGGRTLRYFQNGIVQFYALVFVMGAVCLFLVLTKTL